VILGFGGSVLNGVVSADSIRFDLGSTWHLEGQIVGDSMEGTVQALNPEGWAPWEMGGRWSAIRSD
jgi:hypothetical protein